MLGVPVERTKLLLVVLGVVATAAVSAVAGPIVFVALAAPQIARRLTGHGTSVDLAGSGGPYGPWNAVSRWPLARPPADGSG